ncbi:uncharacterized protein KIAA1958-like [Ptychodera flava]|uniref:uncharacterized protein KIAA1958-like n=1 Tax=Ptychodera flava TaxID=63121 RepID=UPI00396A5818
MNLLVFRENKNTVKNTSTAGTQFTEYVRFADPLETRPIEDMPANDLDDYLSSFFLSTRQKDGCEYEPDTLTDYQKGIDRYLQEKNYGLSISRDNEFKRSRNVLAAKRSALKKYGKGNKPYAAKALTEDEEKIIREKNIIGVHSPKAHVYAVWLNNTKLFGFRGGQENRSLKWGDIKIKHTATNLAYLEFNERGKKTRSGQVGKCPRPFNPNMFATPDNPETCPVETFKEYARRRPQDFSSDDHPFNSR